MGEGRNRTRGPIDEVGTARPRATTAAGASLPATRSSPSAASGLDRPPLSSQCRLGESVADAEHRLDVLRSDLAPDVLDVRVDRALIRLECQAANHVQELRASENPTRLPRHHRDDLKLAPRQIHAPAGETRFHT